MRAIKSWDKTIALYASDTLSYFLTGDYWKDEKTFLVYSLERTSGQRSITYCNI